MSRAATILVVEDEEALLEGIADLLQVAAERYLMRVVTATNGEEALACMAQEPPDLIISDIMMPRMDGYELLSRVRQRPSWVHIPFIFLTAKGKRQDILEGRRMGAELYITKPFSSIELKELVESQLDRTFALREVQEQNLQGLKRDIMQLLNHEFRTPLTYVNAYYEMLADSLNNLHEGSNFQDYLRGIQTGSKRLTKLVEDLIRIMDFRTGEAALRFEQESVRIENIGELLLGAGRARKQEAALKGIEIIERVAADLPAIIGQPAELSDAFDRLIDNAIKFSPDRPGARQDRNIYLRADTTSQYVRITVQDQGMGFPLYVRDQLFDPFFQYDRQRLEQQGSGSGLAIVKGVADLHHAQLEVSSREGEGSTFRLLLPRCDDGDEQQGGMNGRPRKVLVLVVEDDRFLLVGLQELLEVFEGRYQIEVLTAENGKEGLAVLENNRPDLIISDVMMPVMDGYEFLHAVRQRPSFVHIPVIFLTARREPHDIHRGLLSGVEEYIPKPYEVDELLYLVVTQLDRHFQMQVAANQSLEDIKRGILDLLQPDFKAPLASVNEYTQKLEQGLADIETDEDLKQSLQGIRQASERLTDLVEDFIAMAELKTGETEAIFDARTRRYSGSELQALLQTHCYEYQLLAERMDIHCRLEIRSDLPAVVCDLEGVLQSLDRLFEIILYISGQKGMREVTTVATTHEGMLLLGFRVEGNYLPEAEVQELQRLSADEAAERVESLRYGSSLLVVQGVLKLHDGRLLAENVETGARIGMLLPVQAVES